MGSGVGTPRDYAAMIVEGPSPPVPREEQTLVDLYRASARVQPDGPALWVNGKLATYRGLLEEAEGIARAVSNSAAGTDEPACALLAYRSRAAFAGLLGAMMAGKAYVPLSPRLPLERNCQILEKSGALCLIVEPLLLSMADDILARTKKKITVIVADGTHRGHPSTKRPPHPEHPAYILFTSGSTGRPKGVAVTHANVLSYVHSALERYRPNSKDRFSNLFDLTFDLSVHDMFLAWGAGACLYCLPETALISPGAFINEHQLTFWFSTPSTPAMAIRYGVLKPGAYPSLRWSLFCGEALPQTTAVAWSRAAPNSAMENLYGPTEATIAITAYPWWKPDTGSPIVPIGLPFPGQSAIVVDGALAPLIKGRTGELLVSGSQVTPGYWREPELTADRYIKLKDSGKRWYRTGDLVHFDKTRGFIFHGREDHQIKVLGHRVELFEIEAVLRALTGSDLAVALGWPQTASGADGIIAFVANGPFAEDHLKEACARRLPSIMVPREIRSLDKFPMTASGKIDRLALLQLCGNRARP